MGDVYVEVPVANLNAAPLKQVETCISLASHFGQLRLKDDLAASPRLDWSKAWQGWYPGKAARIPRQRFELMTFNYIELEAAIRKFCCATYFLGKGPYGNLFRAFLNLGNSATVTHVTVEQLDPISCRVNKMWRDEVEYLGQHGHRDILKLIGYGCEEPDKAFLVYEPTPDNILRTKYLSEPTDIWYSNMLFALGVAEALRFLHELDPPFVWRDPTIEIRKIHLDHELTPKIYNFCSSTSNHPHVKTKLLEAPAYAAPEYYQTGIVSPSCNVYSFGVLLLQLISGREPFDESRPAKERNLVDWARPLLSNDWILDIMDPRLEKDCSVNSSFMVAAWVAEHCIKRNAKLRPSMSEVCRGMHYALQGLPYGRTKDDFMRDGPAHKNVLVDILSKLFFD